MSQNLRAVDRRHTEKEAVEHHLDHASYDLDFPPGQTLGEPRGQLLHYVAMHLDGSGGQGCMKTGVEHGLDQKHDVRLKESGPLMREVEDLCSETQQISTG